MSKLNVLVYNGSGVSASSRDYTLHSLRTFLSHRYDVQLVTPKTLREEPWTDNCALLVFPGGRDLPYLFDLSGKPNRRIKEYVENGGKYLGICAGAYYACQEIEFEKGTALEVTGQRELGFFPGLCRGTTFPGFEYETEAGARETSLALRREAWRDHWSQSPDHCEVWYNGGGSFVLNPDGSPPKGVQVLAEYEETEPKQVAGVLCSVGKGQALLWAVHPEHPSLDSIDGSPRQEKELHRLNLVRGTLSQLGLDVSDGPAPLPKLLPLVLASSDPSVASQIASEIASRGEAMSHSTAGLVDRNDTFVLHPASSFDSLVQAARSRQGTTDPEELRQEQKLICVCDESPLPKSSTPLFDISAYFNNLAHLSNGQAKIGQALLYGEVVTSTQTMLDKNDTFLSAIPSGLVCLASHQVAGRGRGGNSWISPAGCLQFSLVTRIALSESSRIVFVQYLFGLAVVEAVRSSPGYEKVGVCLKWPNDIYADMGEGEGMERYKKIGGILVNSSFASGEFTIVTGCGINTSNPKPTTSLNELVDLHNRRTGSNLAPFTPELLLALILAKFGSMWETFQTRGFDPFVDAYLRRWIHTDQRVTLETNSQPVRIVGVTPDHGLLRTVPINVDRMGNEVFGGGASFVGQPQYIDLQPDGNRFDLMKGMLYAR
ncbi:biotin--[acetyl-CoA-carboxylase] ligase BPL1 [Sporobolomyces salmoneus]|uniref:biotin--[acetyl-CoA-carboxylase] ligase BPL1 n=1 Tax=Sporobolomyces salmoneus TaxID=183962 RepID=UPI0031726949